MKRPTHGGNRDWAAAIADCLVSQLSDFSASINPLGPPKSALVAIENSLGDLIHYPDPNYTELRSALAQKHQLSPDWILPGNGSAELLTWAAWDLSKLEKVNLVTPAFADYGRALRAFDLELLSCPLDLKNGEWQSKATGESAGLILNNPHNPTGHLWTKAQILPLLEDYGLIVLDEAFMDFLAEPESLIPLIEEHPNLVILRSLTKFYSLPGLRIGYAVAHPERLKRWQNWRDPWPVNILADAVARAVIKDDAFQALTWNWLALNSSVMFEGLKNIQGLRPRRSAVNFFLVHTRYPSPDLQKKLLTEHKILIRDCLSFPELGSAYFRVALRTFEDNQRLLKALTSYVL